MTADLFSPRDLQQMASMGLDPGEAARQVALFRNPPPHTHVVRPCRPGDGIRSLTPAEHAALLARFDAAAREERIGKFVPASGAATRMFQDLLGFLSAPANTEPSPAVRTFFENLDRFAFRGDLGAYANLPKGLLPFHRYPEGARTPFEEHLVEAATQIRSGDGRCLLHFTVSPEHQDRFEQLLGRVRSVYEERFDCRFSVSFSTQRRSTDTLAVDPENRPFRLADGSLLFRPGGHGALLENLNELGRQGWDIVLLKNIDNVVPDARKPVVHLWKRLLGGCLLSLRERIFGLLDRLEAGDDATSAEATELLERDLSRPLPEQVGAGFLIDALDRPLRVCGVVRNQGEPGGGPFWVRSSSGEISPQIVEISQIDSRDPEQREILQASTHFNPVDIACGLLDRHGRPYDLHRFVDPSTVFIAEKSHEGRPLKALERPGLWNGAMAGWNTVFVEVPDATFAPVKTVLDLLRPEHQ